MLNIFKHRLKILLISSLLVLGFSGIDSLQYLIKQVYPITKTVVAAETVTDQENAVRQNLLTTVKDNNPQEKSPFTILLIAIGSILAIIVIGLIVLYFYNQEKRRGSLYRDQKRKYDLERIRYSLSAFAKTYGRYPDVQKGEFLELLKQIEPFPMDSLADKDVGFNYQKYNYYYDNQSLDAKEKGRLNTTYYRLWCHLENGNDLEINRLYSKTYKNIYLRTSSDALNPTLLEVPQKELSKKEEKKQKKEGVTLSIPVTTTPAATISATDITLQRKESMIHFLLIITSGGLIISAIINGILYYLIRYT